MRFWLSYLGFLWCKLPVVKKKIRVLLFSRCANRDGKQKIQRQRLLSYPWHLGAFTAQLWYRLLIPFTLCKLIELEFFALLSHFFSKHRVSSYPTIAQLLPSFCIYHFKMCTDQHKLPRNTLTSTNSLKTKQDESMRQWLT